MKIEEIKKDKKAYLPLLLLGDEQESMIDRYLDRGEMFAAYDEEANLLCIAVVTDEGGGVCELKNIAVAPAFQRRGYGRKMISHLCRHYSGRFSVMQVGTGDSRQTVSFYEHCGFRYSHSVADFFTRNYDHPIVEEGKRLTDMLYFSKRL